MNYHCIFCGSECPRIGMSYTIFGQPVTNLHCNRCNRPFNILGELA